MSLKKNGSPWKKLAQKYKLNSKKDPNKYKGLTQLQAKSLSPQVVSRPAASKGGVIWNEASQPKVVAQSPRKVKVQVQVEPTLPADPIARTDRFIPVQNLQKVFKSPAVATVVRRYAEPKRGGRLVNREIIENDLTGLAKPLETQVKQAEVKLTSESPAPTPQVVTQPAPAAVTHDISDSSKYEGISENFTNLTLVKGSLIGEAPSDFQHIYHYESKVIEDVPKK